MIDLSRLPPLSDLLEATVHKDTTHTWVKIRLAATNRKAAAIRVAVQIAADRCGGAPQYFDAWRRRYESGPPHAPEFLECLQVFVASESIGTRAQPAAAVHLNGFVAEHIWHLLTLENAVGFETLLRVDGPDWSVTDSGGDGLAVYRAGHSLVFRLWESKAHVGEGSVRDVVNGACNQVSSNALRYLARFSKIGQALDDAELRAFYGRMPELWKAQAREAGGGISVSTASADDEDYFGSFSNYWKFAHNDQRQGLVIIIDKYADFAKCVREQLWKGL